MAACATWLAMYLGVPLMIPGMLYHRFHHHKILDAEKLATSQELLRFLATDVQAGLE